ncbi:SHOCT domain-containing protein [Stenotrophomonas sp. ATCM1_4]|uniref:SHOCT domain-containing protein n=1 Tax=unclassified Stenotrophomonas TaxID=196198 RepID=UPI00104356C5|nr:MULTISPECIES: SHOCT domain-containing protein [unclassified Stenotrophomonas]MBD9535925.1 SHOCT domain-containing protein [Stenotrophomonas sp. STM01]TDB27457.1 SHOCT domain-containing protein [Stenotrophomonas sp. ATCM1_4]
MEPSAGVQVYHWVVWLAGVGIFAAVTLAVIVAIVRARRRPAELHSAAERLQREAALQPEADARLRALSQLKERGQIGEAEYEKRRAELLKG